MHVGRGRWDETLAFLQQAHFDDLFLPGRVERDHPIPVVRPWFFDTYLAADLGCLHVRLSDDHGSLQLNVIPEIVPDQDWLDGDEELVLTSIEPQLLGGSLRPAQCTALRYWTNSQSDLDQGLIRCIELSFGDLNHLVLDAVWIDGIRIGTHGAAEHWLDHQADRTLTEHRWTRPDHQPDHRH